MIATTRWWWIRHAPVLDDNGRVYGQVDLAADVSMREAFAGLARKLPRDAVWITSHLQRTKQTAAAIAEAGRWTPETHEEPDLAEQHFGEWQGQERGEVRRRHSDWRGFWLAPADVIAPGGESFAQLVERAGAVIRRRTAAHCGRDIVAVAHGGTIRAALSIALGLPADAALAFEADNLSLTRLDHINGAGGDAWRVSAVNLPPH